MHTAIIGGGIAGLTAAAYLARAGRAVTVFEKSHRMGGRARTELKHGFAFNFGPHALYRHGAGVKILHELGVEFSGKINGTDGAFAIDNGAKHTLPGGFVSLLTTGLLNLPAKLEAAKLLANLPKLETTALDALTVREWLAREVKHPKVAQFVQALFRVATYTNDPERQSAGAALRQFQMALSGGVYYLDNGWQTLVNGLRAVAEQAGATIQTDTSITAIERSAQGFVIQFANGQSAAASSVLIAASPTEAAALVKANETLTDWARTLMPVRAACLDVALTHLPEPHARFGLGIDQPYYFSVHSATAKLAPDNGAMIHVAKYLPTHSDEEAHAIEQQLEQVFDLLQPGWRKAVVARRFLPRITVTNALLTTSPRPTPAVPGLEGLYVTGDWVGHEGQLVDASFASAKTAAALIAQQPHRATATV